MCRRQVSVFSVRTGPGLTLGLLLVAVCGCQTPDVHYVSDTDTGGVVGIPNNSDVWPTYYRTKALELIAAKCPNGYEIVHEEEVRLSANQHQGANDSRFEYTGALEQIPERKEYRLTFRCLAPPPLPSPKPLASPIEDLFPPRKSPPVFGQDLWPPRRLPSSVAPQSP